MSNSAETAEEAPVAAPVDPVGAVVDEVVAAAGKRAKAASSGRRRSRAPPAGAISPSTTALLTPKATAAILGVTPGTLAAWRGRGEGPPALRLTGRTFRYRQQDIDALAPAARKG